MDRQSCSAFRMKPIASISYFSLWSSERISLWALISQRSSLLLLMVIKIAISSCKKWLVTGFFICTACLCPASSNTVVFLPFSIWKNWGHMSLKIDCQRKFYTEAKFALIIWVALKYYKLLLF